jgi:predicted dehydrogenase
VIRLGLIGCGAWGRRYVSSALEAGTCIVTHAAGTPNADLHGVEFVPSMEWRRLLDAPVDAFIVATPPGPRLEICGDLLARGRPVMAEKPLALSSDQAQMIAWAATSTGTPLLVNHQHLFAPAYEELRARSEGWRSVGVFSAGGGQGPVREYSALWDYGAHDVAMFLGLTKTRRAFRVRADRHGGIYRVTMISGDHAGLARVWCDGPPKTRVLSVLRGAEMLVYDDLDPQGGKLRHDGRQVPISPEKPLTRALRAFVSVVRGGPQDWRFDPYLGVEVTRILAQAEATLEVRDGEDDHD